VIGKFQIVNHPITRSLNFQIHFGFAGLCILVFHIRRPWDSYLPGRGIYAEGPDVEVSCLR